MEPADAAPLSPSPETPRGEVEIKQDAAITIGEALIIAAAVPFPLGKSTLQRWARHWAEQGAASPVKCVLVTNRFGASYRIDRDDFEAWVLEQAQNGKPHEVPEDLARSHETLQDLSRPRKVSRDPERPDEASRDRIDDKDAELAGRIKELENENLQLKIDAGVCRELINRASDEMRGLRKTADMLLRENGALHYQLAQLEAPQERKAIGARPIQAEQDRPVEQAGAGETPGAFGEPERPEPRFHHASPPNENRSGGPVDNEGSGYHTGL